MRQRSVKRSSICAPPRSANPRYSPPPSFWAWYTTRNAFFHPCTRTLAGTPGSSGMLATAGINNSFGVGPTQIGSCRGSVFRKKTEAWCLPWASLVSGTSREASSATSWTKRSYRASRGVFSETSASTSASPLSQASLRWRMSLAISKYMIAKAIALPRANAAVGQMAIRQAADRPCDLVFLKNIADTADGMDSVSYTHLTPADEEDSVDLGGR